VLDETRAFNEQLRALLVALPSTETVPPEVTRRARYEGRGVFPPPVFLPAARWLDADGVRVRVLAPEAPRGVYLHLHGGGWTIGAPDLHDEWLSTIAESTGLAVASVEYRLAPEHPFPAGPDDCEIAARWLVGGGHLELGAPPLFAIGGESAGAHLAVLTLLRLREEATFAAANLVYGAYDLAGTPSRRRFTDALVLTGAVMDWFTGNFLPGLDAEQRRAPEISPLYADLHDLPPALFSVGTLDPLLDDTLFMAARWQAAGNEAELRVYEEAVHGFNAFPIAVATLANEAQLEFLTRVAAAAAA
jgi:acetyl esterase